MNITLPIYYTVHYKTKPPKHILVGLNQLFLMHFIQRNNLKQSFHLLITQAVANSPPITGKFTVHYKLYYKNTASDPGNIIAGIEKVLLDGLQECSYIKQDNPKYHVGSSWEVVAQDKLNPRCEITIACV